jgi:biopolymer transport protein ExbD
VARVSVQGQVLGDSSALESRLRDLVTKDPEVGIRVRADESLPFGAIEPVLQACSRAGASSVRLATERRS